MPSRPKFRSILVAASLSTALALPLSAQTTRAFDKLVTASQEIMPLRQPNLDQRASKRYAIVIGNHDYEAIADLPNAINDARLTARYLTTQGFDVRYHEDVTKRDFEDILRRALFNVDRDTEVVLFFAGHGFQIGADNYLVPVDADLDTAYDVPFETISLGSMVAVLGARARLQVVILDACRDNPFSGARLMTGVGNELRQTHTGFAFQAAPLNSMLMFSTSPGMLAYDGHGENSPFTEALIDEASTQPDAHVKTMFEDVRRRVVDATGGRQIPWDSSTLIEPVSFGAQAYLARPSTETAGGLGSSRGLVPAAITSELLVPANSPSDVALKAPLAPETELGEALIAALELTDGAEVEITQAPKMGRLLTRNAAGLHVSALGRPLSLAETRDLRLVNDSRQIAADTIAADGLMDEFAIRVGPQERRVELQLEPNSCDFEAGDHLDPDGVGLTRYANELRPERALAACEEAVAESPETGRFHYQLGRALRALTRQEEALVAFRKARDLGHARAWVAIGNVLHDQHKSRTGDRSGKAPDDVLQHFARGVAEGDPYAYHNLGRQFLRHGETPEMQIEGFDLEMRALEVGHTFAMNALGFYYLDAESAFYDPERGLRYLRESAARGDIYGYNNMGRVYRDGLGGIEADPEQALAFFERAHAGGHPSAPTQLGLMYYKGEAPGGQDSARAMGYLVEALERGQAYAGTYAAFILSKEDVAGYDTFDRALFLAKAATLGASKSAQSARESLDKLPGSMLDAASQKLMGLLGQEVPQDGDFGPGSAAAFTALTGDAVPDAPQDRLLALARQSWAASPYRRDLY